MEWTESFQVAIRYMENICSTISGWTISQKSLYVPFVFSEGVQDYDRYSPSEYIRYREALSMALDAISEMRR